MANNYQQWATEITDLTEAEMAWFKACLTWKPPYNADYELPDDFESPDWYDWDAEGVGFEYDFHEKGRTLHVYATESGNLNTLEELMREFIEKFRPNYVFTVQWADSCSRMRVDEFGGGAMVVSRLRTEYIDTYRWSQDLVKKMEEELKGGS